MFKQRTTNSRSRRYKSLPMPRKSQSDKNGWFWAFLGTLVVAVVSGTFNIAPSLIQIAGKEKEKTPLLTYGIIGECDILYEPDGKPFVPGEKHYLSTVNVLIGNEGDAKSTDIIARIVAKQGYDVIGYSSSANVMAKPFLPVETQRSTDFTIFNERHREASIYINEINPKVLTTVTFLFISKQNHELPHSYMTIEANDGPARHSLKTVIDEWGDDEFWANTKFSKRDDFYHD
ncbi:MAG: hypothetical protein AAGA25_13390 [Planctomycetota bacterium]